MHLPRFGRHHSSGGGAASVPMGLITPFGWQSPLGADLSAFAGCAAIPINSLGKIQL